MITIETNNDLLSKLALHPHLDIFLPSFHKDILIHLIYLSSVLFAFT